VAAVKTAGYTIANDVMEFPPCRMFIVADADGNKVTLHQRKKS
jgi:predicted enzyme related to lactoylglutathione lyase